MKKIMAMLLSTLLLAAFVGCGEDSQPVSRDKPEGAVELFFQASCKADVDAALGCYPDEMLKFMEDNYDSKSDMKRELRQELKDTLNEIEDDYGKFKRYKFEIVDSETMSKDERNQMEEGLKYSGIDLEISSVKTVEVEYTIYFEDDEYEDSIELQLIKVDGQWYIMRADDLFNYLKKDGCEVNPTRFASQSRLFLCNYFLTKS